MKWQKCTFLYFSINIKHPQSAGCTFNSAKLGLGHSTGNEWKHICEQINFYNLCVFIRYSEANAIKRPKPILYTTRGGGTIPNSNVTSMEQAQILHRAGRLESKWCVYEWICLIKPIQYCWWQNGNFCAVFFFFIRPGSRRRHRHDPSTLNIHAHKHRHTCCPPIYSQGK